MTRFGWGIAILGLILIAQLGARWWQGLPRPPEGPSLGEVLPSVQVQTLDNTDPQELTALLTEDGTCSLLVLISTECPWCQRMRSTWPSRMSRLVREVGIPVKGVWLAGVDNGVLEGFYEGHDFHGVVRARVTYQPGVAFRRLGVYATPTTYLVDSLGHLRYGLVGDRLPPVEIVESICR